MAISPQLHHAVEEDLGRRIWPQLQTVWPLIDYHGLRDAFVIRYAIGEQESLRQHHDVAQVSATVRLDDDHDGADLRFPRQGVDTADLPVGSLLAWPSLVTHPHETTPLRRGRQARADDLVRAAAVRAVTVPTCRCPGVTTGRSSRKVRC